MEGPSEATGDLIDARKFGEAGVELGFRGQQGIEPINRQALQ